MVHGVLGRADPAALGDALRAAGVRGRGIALAIPAVPPRDVWIGTLPASLARSRARRAATLAASQQLKVNPADVVVSLDRTQDGITYVAAAHGAIARWAAPWEAARWRVMVVEPAAVALLRSAGGANIEMFVRTGTHALELVVGSRARWVLARTVELDWAADLGRAQVEVGDTLDLARKAGVEPAGLVIGGMGPVESLVAATADLGPMRPLVPNESLTGTEVPPEAVAAAGMARWATAPRVPRSKGQEQLMARLSRLLHRRSTHAA